MKGWDCRIEIIRDTIVDAEDEDRARAQALDWFFTTCVHAVDAGDVCVSPIEDGDTDAV